MTHFIKITVLIFALITVSCSKKQEKVFSIRGNINPVKNNYLILKQLTDIEKKTSKLIDTIFLRNGKFKKNINLEPHIYSLEINEKKKLILAIDKGQQINIDIDHDNTKITGSNDTNLLLAYEKFRGKSLDSLVKSVRRQVKKIKASDNPNEERIAALELKEIENYKIHLNELNDFIKNNMGNSIAIYATSIRWKGIENLSFFDSLVTNFELAHPNTKIAIKLREKITRLKQTSIGGLATDIKMTSTNNQIINLYSVNKNYTLIDFWASWCGPCRSERKTLNQLYKKYNNDGFEIYNVSLDSKKEKWLKAIEEDKRTWTNVSSLKGFKTKAAYNYAVTSLPTNFIIDKNHKIIAKNLHGEELITFINNLYSKLK